MRLLFSIIISYLLAVNLSFADTSSVSTRIVGGEAADDGEHDYYVALMAKYSWAGGYDYYLMCGGTYLGDGFVVTAAHCVNDYGDSDELYLLVGNYSDDMAYENCSGTGMSYSCYSSDTNDSEDYTGYTVYTGDESAIYTVTGANITVHEDYTGTNDDYSDDIAIIQLDSTPTNATLALPSADTFTTLAEAGEEDSVLVIGHGDTLSDSDTSTYDTSPQLMEVYLTPYEDSVCEKYWNGPWYSVYDGDSMACAGDVSQDSCSGDSGGPLLYEADATLLGIVSWGSTLCGSDAGSYSAYTDVYQYVDWVASVIESASESDAVAAASTASVTASEETADSSDVDSTEVSTGSLDGFILFTMLLLLSRRRLLLKL
ncbi:S1 family peptidase [Reinekea marinisedimentorum]|uniref:Trypsin n=1 Tax=Reinekea marinisedimentorum TaxID=230495 RepID=A0A4R3I8L9_9GAMM|nr:serine protease [Reinekea marinisedimentorum]TCS41662.1 trypsin [Reinekea marinisedimentorum]